MLIVTYMDEITLWNFSQVNSRWRNIILHCVSNERWWFYTLQRWIFYRPGYSENNWFEVCMYWVIIVGPACYFFYFFF